MTDSLIVLGWEVLYKFGIRQAMVCGVCAALPFESGHQPEREGPAPTPTPQGTFHVL